jgi:hypothetical protein
MLLGHGFSYDRLVFVDEPTPRVAQMYVNRQVGGWLTPVRLAGELAIPALLRRSSVSSPA